MKSLEGKQRQVKTLPLFVIKKFQLGYLAVAGLLFCAAAGGVTPPSEPGVSFTPRLDIVLSSGWKFLQADAPGACTEKFDDTAWQNVELPHCWNIKPIEDYDKPNIYDGLGWYRLHLKTDAAMTGKSLFLRFDAAYHTAEVFINGKSVGSHVGGFAAFCFDVTRFLRVGEANIVAVKVNYTPSFPNLPLRSNISFPGLYRDVHLLVLDPVSISPLDSASSGVYLKQMHVDESAAQIEVSTKLRNADNVPRKVTVRCRIVDAGGTQVIEASTVQTIAASENAEAVQTVTVPHPHLWNGRADAYLYRAIVEVADQGGLKDQVVQPLGLRYFSADAESGFSLNGKPYAIRGVNSSQERFGKGRALSPADMEQDMSILLELGCNGFRTHSQSSDFFYNLCNKSGVLVWAQIPFSGGGWTSKELDDPKGEFSTSPGAEPNSKAFAENTRQQLTEMIKQNFNHPSIVFWGLWNEIGSPKSDADKGLQKSLNILSKDLDPTRLTTGANNDNNNNKITDVYSRNAYYGWYGGTPEDLTTQLPIMLETALGKPLIISEYGAGASILQHVAKPSKISPKGPWHPEEWQAIIHERTWRIFSKAPYLNAVFLFKGFDSSSLERDEGDHPGRNDKGLVTGDRNTRKDAFYFYKANWNSEPMVYITGRRFTPHPSGFFPVKVYSNCTEVELKLNGQSQGVLKNGDQDIFAWDKITLPEGDVRVEALGKRDAIVVTDQCTWKCSSDAPAKLDLSGRAKQVQPAR